MSLHRRLIVFGCVALTGLVVDLAVTASAADFDTGVLYTDWWFVVPALASAALVIRPAWGAAVAGLGAGGVIGLSIDGNAIITAGVNWNAADIFTAVGLVGTAVLLAARMVRIFPDARTELHAKRGRKAIPTVPR
jgi:hypothetical protein